jgi:hypothetical protein
MHILSEIILVLFAVSVIGIFVLTIVGEVAWSLLAIAGKINRKYGSYEAVKAAAFGVVYYMLLASQSNSTFVVWFLTIFMTLGFLNRVRQKAVSK